MNSPVPDAIVVKHNLAEKRFEAEVDGQLCVADYELQDDRMIFTHTFVPPALRGREIAAKLVRAGLDYARGGQKKVVPACSYVAAFVRRHKEYRTLVVD